MVGDFSAREADKSCVSVFRQTADKRRLSACVCNVVSIHNGFGILDEGDTQSYGTKFRQ